MNKFTIGCNIKFIGISGPRWIHGNTYEYIQQGTVTCEDGDAASPTWPNYLEDNFISIQQERNNKITEILL